MPQRRMEVRDHEEARKRGMKAFYHLFDLLYLDGHDLREVPVIERKNLLRHAFEFRDPLRFTSHRQRDGEGFFREACRDGLEGLTAKRASSAYVSKRSRDWLKFNRSAEQEFVIGGYADPRGSRTGFGALLPGYCEGGKLVYAGKAGTGFDRALLSDLSRQLSSLETGEPPFAEGPPAVRGSHWVRPALLAQVAFTEWTQDGKLRHARFLGIRYDKNPRDVVREHPK